MQASNGPVVVLRLASVKIGTVIQHYLAARAELDAPGSPFATTTIEVRGVKLRSFASAPPNMRAIWEASTAHASKDYLVYEDERYTYAEVHAQVRRLAAHLVGHGVHHGSRVAIALRNYPEWVVSYWATVSIGAVVIGINAWWTAPELEYAFNDSEPAVLIADDERLERLNHMPEQRPMHVIAVRSERVVPGGSTPWADVMASNDPGTLPDASIDPDDDATIFYTSGTTGFPKGAQLTHRGSVDNIYNIIVMGLATTMAEQKAIAAGESHDPPLPAPAQRVLMVPTPLFHVTACNCVMHAGTIAGAKLVLMRKWAAGRALELIEREGVTNFSGVPTMSREMLLHPDWALRNTSTLQGMGGGGAALQPDLVDKIADALKEGQPTTAYGMTETCGIITSNSAELYLAKPESCGSIVPTLEAKLVDEAGNDLPVDAKTVGILCVRGSIVIKGYINRPEATADAIRDGWLNTGDIARIDDDGFVFIVDRAKDMVLRGGENVFCSEVETAIYHHDAVAEAAVFGIPDDRLGEDVAAVVVLRPGHTLTADALLEFLAASLAQYKIPAKVWFRTESIPRNASGKFLKRELRAELLED